jgi:hypothetical protein
MRSFQWVTSSVLDVEGRARLPCPPDSETGMMAPQRYDAIVIGTGQGGKPLASALARARWRVAVIERVHVEGLPAARPLGGYTSARRVYYVWLWRGIGVGLWSPLSQAIGTMALSRYVLDTSRISQLVPLRLRTSEE